MLALSFSRQPARAAEADDVEALIEEGVELRKAGRDERALSVFKRAYGIEHTPRTAAQLGLAEMAVGYWLDAEVHLGQALDSASHPWIAKHRDVLTDALKHVRGKIGEVTVTGVPPGATVRVNGRAIGHLPLASPIRVGEGRVEIDVAAPGYTTDSRVLQIAGKEKRPHPIALAPGSKNAALPQSTRHVMSGSAPAPTKRTEASSVAGSSVESDHKGKRTLAYVAAAASVLSIAFGVFETVRWKNKEDEFNSHLAPIPGQPVSPDRSKWIRDCGGGEPQRGGAECERLYSAGALAWKLALVGYGVGGGLAVGALVLFLTDQQRVGHEHALVCSASAEPWVLGCRWSF